MKKKIIVSISLILFVLGLKIPSEIKAACVKAQSNIYCAGTSCSTSINFYCCATQAECSAIQTTEKPVDIQCGTNGISTAIGCINVFEGPEAFFGDILRWGVGIGGGIAFLLIIYASFMIMTSGGNPERLKAGQELLTSAISGLILLIFSIFVLRFIGIDILGLNQFGFGQ